MTLQQELADADRLHRDGRLTEAARICETILGRYPSQIEALKRLGAIRKQEGQSAQAVAHFRAVVAFRPHDVEAHVNLVRLLLELGHADEAVTHCRLALALEPRSPHAHNRLGETFRAVGRFRDAIASYVDAIRLGPDMAQAHANLGIALRQDGRLAESVHWFRRATELEPDNLAFLGYLTDALIDLDRYPEAIDCCARMIRIEPNRPLLHSNLAWLLQREGRHDEAGESYREALRQQPDFADALIGMGGLMEELGRMKEAEAWFRRAIESHPADTIALARLARPLRYQLSDHDLALLERRVADPSLAETARTGLLFALANVLDARGRYAEAAASMRRANAAAAAENQARARLYRPADHERLVTNMIAAFRPELFAQFDGAGLETRRPVFIFGLPRSGTSLIEQILASHSECHGAGELTLGLLNFEAIPPLLKRTEGPLACLRDLGVESIRQLAGRHEARLLELGRGAPRVTDKLPDNYLYLGLLAILFPGATFIHCRRDSRDIAVSCWITHFRSLRWTNDPRHMAHRFTQYFRLMDHWRTVLPVPIHEVDYEETVDNLEEIARRLVAACGLEWEPACLAFHRNERPVNTSSLAQVRQPIYNKAVGRWKNYEHELGDLFAALEPVISIESGGRRRVP